MKYLLVLLTFCSISCFGQGDEAGVKSTINLFFEGMRKADSSVIKATLAPAAILQTIVHKKEDSTAVETEEFQKFIEAVTKPHPEVYDERITFDVIKIDAELAMAWTPYKFYVGSTFSHCGVDCFQLVKLQGAWKIQYIIDTQRKEACP